jgi:hypothetical protein
MYFGSVFFKTIASNFVKINENSSMKNVLNPVFEQYKCIGSFMNDLSLVNLKSWRKAYPKANRFRHSKLPRSRIIVSQPFDTNDLIKSLNSLAYNIDYDCKALVALKKVIENILEHWIDSNELKNDSDLFKIPEKSLIFWNFRLFYDALDSLKHNHFAYCSSTIRELNWNGVNSFNSNNKICYGIKRSVGGIRASYLRSIDNRINEKFDINKSNHFVNETLYDILLYALKVLVHVKRFIVGQTESIVLSLYNCLINDFLYNGNILKK